MKSPPAATLYRFIPAARREEFGERLKNANSSRLANFFELREPRREPGFFKWFSYAAQVIGAAWTNRERIDDRKLVLVGMKSVLALRARVDGFADSLGDDLKSLRDRSVAELAADARVDIGSLAEMLGMQLDRVAVNEKGSPYLLAEGMSEEDRAAQIERGSRLREAKSRLASPHPIVHANRTPAPASQVTKDAMLRTETQQVPDASTRVGRSERRQRVLSSRSVNPARSNADPAPATRASFPPDFRKRLDEFASSAVENWAQLPWG